MSDSDEDFPSFVVMLDYFCRKIRASSRVPRNFSVFNGRNRTLELLSGPDAQFVEVLRSTKNVSIGCRAFLQKMVLEIQGPFLLMSNL